MRALNLRGRAQVLFVVVTTWSLAPSRLHFGSGLHFVSQLRSVSSLRFVSYCALFVELSFESPAVIFALG
jgi:hypothetical protein